MRPADDRGAFLLREELLFNADGGQLHVFSAISAFLQIFALICLIYLYCAGFGAWSS